jgi:hypothetical protein
MCVGARFGHRLLSPALGVAIEPFQRNPICRAGASELPPVMSTSPSFNVILTAQPRGNGIGLSIAA